MDKRKVINAYRNGFITIQECAQILGLHSTQAVKLITDLKLEEDTARNVAKRPVNQ